MLTLAYVKDVCKLGHGALCCRYLTAGADGFGCEKLSELRAEIDSRAATMRAQGDNCAGVPRDTRVWRLKADRFEHKAGTLVYSQRGHDYGLASDDSRATGLPHISVTLNADGSYPGFTVPLADLEQVTP